MVQRLSPAVIQMLTRKPMVTIEVDAETHRLMAELAHQAGSDVPALLIKLAQKYKNASWVEKEMVVNFLNGV